MDVVGDDLYHDDHVNDDPAPLMMYPVPPADDLGYLPHEPPPAATPMHWGCRYHLAPEESFLPPFGGFPPPPPPPGGFI